MKTITIFLATITGGFLIIYLRIMYKELIKTKFLSKLWQWLKEDGFEKIADETWQKANTVYKISANISPLLAKDIGIGKEKIFLKIVRVL